MCNLSGNHMELKPKGGAVVDCKHCPQFFTSRGDHNLFKCHFELLVRGGQFHFSLNVGRPCNFVLQKKKKKKKHSINNCCIICYIIYAVLHNLQCVYNCDRSYTSLRETLLTSTFFLSLRSLSHYENILG